MYGHQYDIYTYTSHTHTYIQIFHEFSTYVHMCGVYMGVWTHAYIYIFMYILYTYTHVWIYMYVYGMLRDDF